MSPGTDSVTLSKRQIFIFSLNPFANEGVQNK